MEFNLLIILFAYYALCASEAWVSWGEEEHPCYSDFVLFVHYSNEFYFIDILRMKNEILSLCFVFKAVSETRYKCSLSSVNIWCIKLLPVAVLLPYFCKCVETSNYQNWPLLSCAGYYSCHKLLLNWNLHVITFFLLGWSSFRPEIQNVNGPYIKTASIRWAKNALLALLTLASTLEKIPEQLACVWRG